MYPDERSFVDDAFLYLQQAVSGASLITVPPIRKEHVEAIMSLLERWPSGSRFPRMFVVHDRMLTSVDVSLSFQLLTFVAL